MPSPNKSLSSIACLLIGLFAQLCIHAQVEFTLPPWMTEVIGKERADSSTFLD